MTREHGRLEGQIEFYKKAAWVFVVLGAAAAAWGIYKTPKADIGNLASLGSFLQGTTASLFSLAALFLIYVAFLGQKQQMHMQQQELDDQKKQFEIQHFESGFFQLVTIQNQIVDGLKLTADDEKYEGRACFEPWCNELYQIFMKQDDSIPGTLRVSRAYEIFYDKYQGELSHYFRNLYHIIKFVDVSNLEEQTKRRYTSLVRAQLSAFELVFLNYNCVISYGREKFLPLVDKYNLLENMNEDLQLLPLNGDSTSE